MFLNTSHNRFLGLGASSSSSTPIVRKKTFHHGNGFLGYSVLDPADTPLGHSEFFMKECPGAGEYCPSGSKGDTSEYDVVQCLARECLPGRTQNVSLVRGVLSLFGLFSVQHGLPGGLIWHSPV